MFSNPMIGYSQSGFTAYFSSRYQWEPSLVSHDPSPPLPLLQQPPIVFPVHVMQAVNRASTY